MIYALLLWKMRAIRLHNKQSLLIICSLNWCMTAIGCTESFPSEDFLRQGRMQDVRV
jgi:hypothetical protein